MPSRLTEVLVCPECGGPIEPRDTPGESDGQFGCSSCQETWPVRNGVARLLTAATPKEVSSSGERFGFEWTTYDDLAGFYEDQFLAWISPARREDFEGKHVLDAGCGKGRHMVLAHHFGASTVLGVDVGMAVEAAKGNTKDLPGCDVVQADLLRLPLKAAFDLIYCVGVLHHLPDPEDGFRSIVRKLLPGGRIHVWVYGHEGNWWIRTLCDPIRKHILRALPPRWIQPLAALVTAPLMPLCYLYKGIRAIAPGIHKHLFYSQYLTFLADLPLRSVYWIVFDQMVAPTTHYIREAQLRGWLEEAGLEDIQVTSLRGMSWRGTGRAPERSV